MRFLVLILLLQCKLAVGQTVAIVPDAGNIVNLALHAEYIADTTGSFGVNDILFGANKSTFRPLNNSVVNFGLTPMVFWVRVKIENRSNQKLFVEIDNHALTDIKFYEISNGAVQQHYHTGNWLMFSKREVQHVNYLFPLSVQNAGAATILIRVQHYRGTQFNLLAGALPPFYNVAAERNLLEGIYYGFILLMILYNLFIFFSLKDKSYLYYVIYTFMMGLLNASINGYSFQYVWPSIPGLNKYEDVISSMVGISGILFASSFLNTKKNTPFYHNIFIALLAAYLIVIAVILSGNFLVGSVAVEVISLVLVVIFFITAYQILQKGYKPARFFLIAWTLLLISVIIFIMKDFKLLPYTAFTVGSLQIGSAVEAMLLSMALANRINVYKRQRRQAQLETLRSLEENKKLITEQNVILEQQVQLRTAELQKTNNDLTQALEHLTETQVQLLQKEKMASLGELTAGIAHEIQNPLNFVTNFSEINGELATELINEIKELPVAEVQKNSLVNIVSGIKENGVKVVEHSKRADAIVKNMLQHSRKNAGAKEPTDLNALAEQYMLLSYHGLRAKDKSFTASFAMELDPALPKIKVSPQDISRVLLNLFNNAFYAVHEKARGADAGYQPLVTLITKQENNKSLIIVKDNGCGIAKEIQDKIFQPFFTTKPSGEGTGLGLSLSYDIINKGHGGDLQVRSAEKEWTEFIILLPQTPQTLDKN